MPRQKNADAGGERKKGRTRAYSIPPELAALYVSEAKARKVSISKLVARAMAEYAAANDFKLREPAEERTLSPKAEKYLKEHGIEL